ncbi:hypothetical protein [Gordonia sp. SL306]|uniref:hypothetical protein n=1 Tax=Gordonia sp. SL306 TaxID=2995145 RepID=UPI002270F24F|nr:hypothetical protein [Gordonia sp. SL306]WAC57560.1 hypothetical protein OVA31_10165 [Gordonia sp. SL306]
MRSGFRRAAQRSALAVALFTGVAISVAAPASAAPPPTVIHDCTGNAFVKPKMIDSIFCADVSIIVTDIHWSRWSPTLAVGHGIEHRKTCVPNCAEGPIEVRPVDVTLFAPKGGEFTHIRLVDKNGVITRKLTDPVPS